MEIIDFRLALPSPPGLRSLSPFVEGEKIMRMKPSHARGIQSVVVAAAVAALAGGAVLAGLAIAHNRTFSNSVTLRYAGPGGKYNGRVNSGIARCERNREVQVWRRKASGDVRQGTTFTNAAGRWNLFASPGLGPNRKVYALIETKVLVGNAQHNHNCAVDRSPVRTIPYP